MQSGSCGAPELFACFLLTDPQELCESAAKKHSSLAANFANLGVDDTRGGHASLDARPPYGHDGHAMEASEASCCPSEDTSCSDMGRNDCDQVRLLLPNTPGYLFARLWRGMESQFAGFTRQRS